MSGEGLARVELYYGGRVQGVGFRFTAQNIARGYDVCGSVRNLSDGRVEVVAEGVKDEVEAFIEGIETSDLAGFIHQKEMKWTEPHGRVAGFKILKT